MAERAQLGDWSFFVLGRAAGSDWAVHGDGARHTAMSHNQPERKDLLYVSALLLFWIDFCEIDLFLLIFKNTNYNFTTEKASELLRGPGGRGSTFLLVGALSRISALFIK